jgi:hypothetical protein
MPVQHAVDRLCHRQVGVQQREQLQSRAADLYDASATILCTMPRN